MTHQDGFGETLKFYADRHPDPGKRTALNVQYTYSRSGRETVSVEMVQIQQAGAPPDWGSKVIVQLTQGELTAFCSVLFGLRPEMKGSYHGDAHNKGVAAYNNGQKGASISVSEKGRQLHHMLQPDDRLDLGVFALRRLAEGWKVSPSDAIALLRQSAWMERTSQQ
jgi:hypothetical protein